jgi:hypothetical protein
VEIDSDGKTVKSVRRRLAKRSTTTKAIPASSSHAITRSGAGQRRVPSQLQLAAAG